MLLALSTDKAPGLLFLQAKPSALGHCRHGQAILCVAFHRAGAGETGELHCIDVVDSGGTFLILCKLVITDAFAYNGFVKGEIKCSLSLADRQQLEYRGAVRPFPPVIMESFAQLQISSYQGLFPGV